MRSINLLPILSVSLSTATRLFVSSYSGNITSLLLAEKDNSYSLTPTYNATECGPSPSWLTLDGPRNLLFCVNEGNGAPNGSLSSFRINTDGSISHVQNTTTLPGPVHALIYGNPIGKRGMVLPHYAGSALTTITLKDSGAGEAGFDITGTLPFIMSSPGALPDRQNAPHPHQALLDPTGKYVLVPDLGTDQVRVFSHDTGNLTLTPLDSLVLAGGSGPRHAIFWNPNGFACENCTTFLYVINEIAASVTGYKVTYRENNAGLRFEEVVNTTALGYLPSPQRNAPAEIAISPDNRFLLVSNRNDTAALMSNLDGNNATRISSDTLSTFALAGDGKLRFVQAAPVYGSYPRAFEINSAGNLVAVALQRSSEVVVLRRDVVTGLMGDVVVKAKIEGEVSGVVWFE